MTDDAELLASAYLDDEVTADERARVEADPVLLAEVDRLRVVRDALAATDPAPISIREDHLASALGAWDRLPEAERLGTRDDTGGADATTVAAASAMSGSLKGRSRRRWVLGAAAALMVVVGAGVVLQQIDPTDSNDDTAAEPGADDAVSADGDDEESQAADAETVEEESAAEAPAEQAAPQLAADSAEELAGGDLAEEITALEADSEEAASLSADANDLGPPPEETDEVPVLDSQSDLIEFARPGLLVTETTVPLEELADDETLAQTVPTVPDCPSYGIDLNVGPAMYLDQLVMVGVDRDGGSAIAYDLVTCTLVESLPIPD